MQKLKYAIALSGGMGSGKSTASSIFRLLGFSVIDADKITHKLLNLHKDELARLFSKQILRDGEIDRKALGRIVFSDKNELVKLENFIHPLIRDEIFRESSLLEARRFPYFVDIPLFFEKRDSYRAIEKSLLIYAPKSVQIERVKMRDNLELEQINSRLDSQMDIENKRKLANYVIENVGSLEELTSNCEQIGELIQKEILK